MRQINGARVTDRYIDGLRVRDSGDTSDRRWNRADARVVWSREGGLVEVVDALLSLPEPS